MEKRFVQRKSYLLDKAFQYQFLYTIVVMQLAVTLAASLLGTFIFFIFFESNIPQVREDIYFILTWVALLVVLAVLMGVWSLRFSHRIAGPIFQMRRFTKLLSKGQLPAKPISFREDDWFKSLETDMNSCIEILKNNEGFKVVDDFSETMVSENDE